MYKSTFKLIGMNSKTKLLDQIDDFLSQNPDISPTRFGIEAANDGKIVSKLKSGKDVTLRKADAIYNYIAENSQNHEHSAA